MTKANLSYPIGEYKPRESISKEQIEEWIQALEEVLSQAEASCRRHDGQPA